MSQEQYHHLQHSESVIAAMSATILAALISRGGGADEAAIETAVSLALRLADRVEQRVKSDQEWVKKDAGSAPIVG